MTCLKIKIFLLALKTPISLVAIAITYEHIFSVVESKFMSVIRFQARIACTSKHPEETIIMFLPI